VDPPLWLLVPTDWAENSRFQASAIEDTVGAVQYEYPQEPDLMDAEARGEQSRHRCSLRRDVEPGQCSTEIVGKRRQRAAMMMAAVKMMVIEIEFAD
jgi:hypothetical protein